jgi:protein SCO1/2
MDGAYRLVVIMAVVLAVLVGVRVVVAPGTGSPGASPSVAPASFLYPESRVAPALRLTDQDGRRFDPALLQGGPTLIFFGYTHCPDICPATMGIVSQVATDYGTAMRVIFVTIDPERDTVPWLREYVRYLPDGFSALTGSATEVRAAADAWGVRYAKVDEGAPDAYSMSHTAEVYLVDGTGRLRAHFPFGTDAPAMLETVRLVAGSAGPVATSAPGPTAPGPTATVATASPTASAVPATAAPSPGPLGVEVVSSSIWAGGTSPVIMRLVGPGGRLADLSAKVSVELRSDDGRGELMASTSAVAVRPPGVPEVSYVASLKVPSAGWWRMSVAVQTGTSRLVGGTAIAALDPGGSALVGAPAPTVHTPRLDDVGGVALRITTDPLPDVRLSSTSTTDALAAHRAFVLVVDSGRFKVTPACGKALNLAKALVDRWPAIPFIHLEPYAYDVITDTAVIRGSLSAPTMVPAADAWGVAGQPWGFGSMPWVFVVDGNGIVRAKYQGVVGSEDVDVILSMLAAGG